MANAKNQIIWYLHHYAGSPSIGMSYRPYYLSEQFNKEGWQSFIIAASFHHLKKNNLNLHAPYKCENLDNESFIWIKTPHYHNNGFARIINMLTYAWRIFWYRKQLMTITGRPSCIIVSSGHPFHYLSAWMIKKKYQTKLIFEVRDLWPLSLTELLGVSRFNPLILVLGLIEKFAYKTADHVVSTLPNAYSYIKNFGLSSDKFSYIPNGVSTEEDAKDLLELPENYKKIIAFYKAHGYFLFGYTGAHGIPNALDDLMQAINILQKDSFNQVCFFLVGDGKNKKALKQFVKDNSIDNVIFFDPILKNQIPAFLQEMDALYIGWKNKNIYHYGVSPNKIFEYMLANKPILHAYSGSHDFIQQYECGISVQAENPDAISEGIKFLVSCESNKLINMSRFNRAIVDKNYSYNLLAKNYIDIFIKPGTLK